MNAPERSPTVGDLPLLIWTWLQSAHFIAGILSGDFGDHADVALYLLQSGWLSWDDLGEEAQR